MFYHLLYPLHVHFGVFNVFRYISFRAAMATATALLISLVIGPRMIRHLEQFQIGQEIREEGPESHQVKRGTPTMGGILIITAMALPTLLWADLTNEFVWLAVVATLGFGTIGFIDDYTKVARRRNLGLTARAKFLLQIGFASALGVFVVAYFGVDSLAARMTFPFFKDVALGLGWWYVPFAVLVLTGTSNAVNLTDGLDGLAIGSTLIAAAAFTVLAYCAGHALVADYLGIPNVRGAGELTVFCGAMVGASLGFLWFNCHPAEVFMGDVGSMALGGALGTVALLIKQEFLLVVVGGLFVLEASSVILQVGSFRLRGRRIFRMSPLHHHFELGGWTETKVVIRFWIVAILFALLALATLKLR
jgi:phospho-N-acetylmuramoyl-pentapeptide-transferase